MLPRCLLVLKKKSPFDLPSIVDLRWSDLTPLSIQLAGFQNISEANQIEYPNQLRVSVLQITQRLHILTSSK